MLTVFEYLILDEWILFDIFFIIIAFRNVLDYKKVYKIVFATLLFSISLIIVLNLMGVIPSNFNYHRASGKIRYTMGFNHPNAFAGNLLILLIFYVLQKESLTNVDAVIILMCSIFTLIAPNSLSAGVCMFLLALCIGFIKKGYNIKTVRFNEKKLCILYFYIFIFSIVCIAYLVALTGLWENLISSLSGTLYTRFLYGKEAIDKYGISMFGQNIDMVNERMINENSKLKYFTLDCTYFYMPIVIGLIPTLYYLKWYLNSIKISILSGNKILLCVFIVVTLYAISETSFIMYSAFLFLGALNYEKQN